MLSPTTLDVIDADWSRRLGVPPAALDTEGVTLIAHTSEDFRDYRGLYAYRRNDTCIVAVPDHLLTSVRDTLAALTSDDAFRPETLTAALGDAAGLVVGPAALRYTDTLPPDASRSSARFLTPDDAPALRALAAACDPIEWDHADIDFDRAPIVGCFEASAFVAASSYRVLPPKIATLGIVTHPSHRGRGLGRAAATAATAHAIDTGFVAQWQTLESNLPSIAIARALGYQPYCRTIAIRLRCDGG